MKTQLAQRPTIREVARLSNVSVCTVSLVLSGNPAARRISESTREKVRTTAKSLGYKANSLGRDLQRGYSNQILLMIVSWNLATSHSATAMAISRAAARKNLLLTVHVADDDKSAEEFVTKQNLHNLGGVLILWDSPALEHSALMNLASDGVPVIALLPGTFHTLSAVTIDRDQAGHAATRHLIELGHRKIGFIGDSVTRPGTTLRKLAGYNRAMADAGLEFNPNYVAEVTDYGFSGGQSGFRMLHQRHPDLTAVFCINDGMALGAIEAARRVGMQTPLQFSAIGFGDSAEGRYWSPKLTTFSLECDRVAEKAIDVALEHRKGPHAEANSVLLPTLLLVRESTGPLAAQTDSSVLVKKSREMAITSIAQLPASS